jgi:hypothetical protein
MKKNHPMSNPPKLDNDAGVYKNQNFLRDEFINLKANLNITKITTGEKEDYDDDLILAIGLSRSLIRSSCPKNLTRPVTSIVIYPEAKLIIQSIFVDILNHWNCS